MTKLGPKSRKQIILEYVEALGTAIILALIIKAFIVQAFKIPSGSMESTLLVGDHILVNKLSYGLRIPFSDDRIFDSSRPQRDDIVVFKYPMDQSKDYIKRIRGIEGDLVEYKNKVLYINGQALKEPFVQHVDDSVIPGNIDPRDNFGPVVVPKGMLFVMGDNRDKSLDSRYWGFVDERLVYGKTVIIYWSWDGKRHMPRFNRLGSIVR